MTRIAAVLSALLLFFLLPVSVNGLETEMSAAYAEEYAALMEVLPPALQDRCAELLANPKGSPGIRDEFGWKAVLGAVRDAASAAWPTAFDAGVRLFGLILCAGMFSNMKNAIGFQGGTEAFSLCSTLCFALMLVESTSSLLDGSTAFLTSVTALTNGIAPVLCAVTAAGGQLTGAAVSKASLMLLFALFQNMGTFFMTPMVYAGFCFGIVSAVGGTVRLDGITRCLRKFFTTVLSFLMLLLSFVIGIQGALARSADTFSMKTVKFALGSMIPLIGGALADAAATVSGGLSAIRSAVGGVGILAIMMLLLPILLRLLLYRLVLGLCRGAAELLGCDREANLIGEVHATLGFMLAIVALVSVLFLFVLSLFTMIGGGIG